MDNCIQNASDDLESLRHIFFSKYNFTPYYYSFMKDALRLMRVFYMCGRKWGNRVQCESALSNLEQSIQNHSLEIQFVCLTLLESLDDLATSWNLNDCEPIFIIWVMANNKNHPYAWINDYFREMLNAILNGMEELHQILLSNNESQVKMMDLLDIIDSLLLIDFGNFDLPDLKQSLMFLKSFLRFVKLLQGIEHKQELVDLLIHVKGVLVDVASFIFKYLKWSLSPSFQRPKPNNFRIEPFESQVCGIYVSVLRQASELWESSNNLLEGYQTVLLMADFLDSLIFLLLKLLFCCTRGHPYISDHQMYKLYQGLRFLRTTLRQQHLDKVEELYDKIHDRTGALICQAGVIVFYLLQVEEEISLGETVKLLFLGFEEKLMLVKPEEEEEAPRDQLIACPQTNLLGFIDSILEKMEFKNQDDAADLVVAPEKNKFTIIHDDLAYLRSFLGTVMGQLHDDNGKHQGLWRRVATVAYETEFVLDSLLVGNADESFIQLFDTITAEIELLKTEALGSSPIIEVQGMPKADNQKPLASKILEFDELVVGLDDESQEIIGRLTRGTKSLDVVSIVGMAGIGKTTLAKKVYCDPSVTNYFHVCLWCTVSQIWNKSSLLFNIINRLGEKSLDELSKMSEDDLANTLRRCLKRKRYLIILDDVWDAEVWIGLRNSFPDDSNGSRILLTSRYENVALNIRPDSKPHLLRFLTNAESWELLQNKMCFEEGCPQELLARGKGIATRCKGLPLMILMVAGVLSHMEPCTWGEIEESLENGNLPTTDECKEIIELSYLHLPECLKPCFLYFGAYEEDEEVSVHEVVRLWIAEGFVKETENEYVEDVAMGYAMELVQRNLIMVAERGSRGRAKSCVLHDLLLDLCRAKGKQEHFLHHLHCHELGISIDPKTLYRLHVNPDMVKDFEELMVLFPRLRTVLFTDKYTRSCEVHWYDILYNCCHSSKLLRVLSLNRIFRWPSFPCPIQLLGHLKYLAFAVESDASVNIPSSIAYLSNLEFFIIQGSPLEVLLPQTVWNMKKLRHMKAKSWVFVWGLPSENPNISTLENARALCGLLISGDQVMEEFTQKFPNVRRLRCTLCLVEEDDETSKFFTFDLLSRLESLHIDRLSGNCVYQFQFPQNIKKLTLINLELPWSEISAIDRLVNLEVLKLDWFAFAGETWHVGEESTFPKLRFLKLERMDLVRWTMDSEECFPCLEKLVVGYCRQLEELPIYFAQSLTLQMIQVIECDRAADSVKKIEEMKTDWGNEDLKIHLQNSNWEELMGGYETPLPKIVTGDIEEQEGCSMVLES
ncbi:OLC1v1005940C1 [Oldenlandia corymbosa var. corymbosa]|uniref:OLC1v1005940C1 n=1 Tax=Oldenlandia corymbosa var. corymbosa TaxID=529605 RepID=A0AAV1DFS4_OLDCO|nr:OLC1v1005940C1 [Oldenlandia corymbosa var. corymbosa]